MSSSGTDHEHSSNNLNNHNNQDNNQQTSKLRTWQRRVAECKKKHRPKLVNWKRDEFGTRRLQEFNELKLKYLQNNIESIERIPSYHLTVEKFIDDYERNAIPVIIQNIPKDEHWKAHDQWDFTKFRHIRNRYFKVGEDDDGYSVKMRLKYFLKYLETTTDDSPLYIFDSRFENDPVGKSLLDDYRVPSYFPEDLFSLVGEKRRPPYRWFLVGPARSGTTVHIDPLGTSAWNTVLKGLKLWVLFPPHTEKRFVKALDVIKKGEDDEAINYFVDHIPRLLSQFPSSCREMKIFYQYPGETVFVPGGWWHAVLNLEHSIAITQNYVSHQNFERVWIRTKKGRKKMAIKWKKLLSISHPDLASLADLWDSIKTEKSGEKETKKGTKRKNDDTEREARGSNNSMSTNHESVEKEKKRKRCSCN